MPPYRAQVEQDEQRNKLASSYQSLLTEFSSKELRTVGNYTIGALIGKGSFGKVYLATHNLTNGTRVVLKSANKDDANLAREIHHHRQFLHPHIARLYEVIVTEEKVWLVLEYCAGDELYNHLLQHGRMDTSKVQKIFTQLVGAVTFVHQKGCVHRDLKLENILLDKHENVKLVDFGFTREYSGTTSYLQTWCGTVCYSAPEMIKGEKYAGEKVDVWSLGIILYALLCGELPFDDDDDNTTKAMILKEDAKFPEHVPQAAQDLIKRLLSKRPLLRPTLSDLLKDPWLAEHAPQQQEILKLQQPAPFTTQLEKDVLERMRSAGVDIDMVIENVLSQRCDGLAGWWALLLEKEQRKERRRERKRKEREAEAKSMRRLSAASSRLLALGEIFEGEEGVTPRSPRQRGRPLSRSNGLIAAAQAPDLPKVTEQKSPPPQEDKSLTANGTAGQARHESRSGSRPPLPPKDYNGDASSRPDTSSRGKTSTTQPPTPNPDLLSPTYIPPPARKRPKFYPQPLKEQLAWVKEFFKDGKIRRQKAPTTDPKKMQFSPIRNSQAGLSHGNLRDLRRPSLGQGGTASRRASVSSRTDQLARASGPQRPKINTTSSGGSIPTARLKRTSVSPGTIHQQSTYRRSSVGLRGRKSTSSSVSSIRTTYQGTGNGVSGHHHSHSKASSTSSNSIALSPSALSSVTSGSRLTRVSQGAVTGTSIKVLPSTPTSTTFPSGIKFTRRVNAPIALGGLPTFNLDTNSGGLHSGKSRGVFGGAPTSPGLPVFARRKRSVFKGPLTGGVATSPSGIGRNSSAHRNGSVQGRPSTDIMMPGVVEEEDEEDDDEEELYEDIEVDQFGREIDALDDRDGVNSVPITPVLELNANALLIQDEGDSNRLDSLTSQRSGKQRAAIASQAERPNSAKTSNVDSNGSPGTKLTAAALARMDSENEAKEAEGLEAGHKPSASVQ